MSDEVPEIELKLNKHEFFRTQWAWLLMFAFIGVLIGFAIGYWYCMGQTNQLLEAARVIVDKCQAQCGWIPP